MCYWFGRHAHVFLHTWCSHVYTFTCTPQPLGRKRCSRQRFAGRISSQQNGTKFWINICIFGSLQVHLYILHPCIRPQIGVLKGSEQCQGGRITNGLSRGGVLGWTLGSIHNYIYIYIYYKNYDSKEVRVCKPDPRHLRVLVAHDVFMHTRKQRGQFCCEGCRVRPRSAQSRSSKPIRTYIHARMHVPGVYIQ